MNARTPIRTCARPGVSAETSAAYLGIPLYESEPGEFARFLDAVKEAREGLADCVARVEAWLSGQGV